MNGILGDDSRARREGWTQVTTPVDDIMEVFVWAWRYRLRLPRGA